MAKSRRNVSRKASRKNRKSRRANRKNSVGLAGKLYGPIHQVIGLAQNTVSTVTNTTRNVAKKGLQGVNRIGQSITGRTDKAIRGLISRKRRDSRKNRKDRK